MKDLTTLTEDEFRKFINGVEYFLFDCDGVINTTVQTLIPDVDKAINALRSLGKQVYYISNNTTLPLDKFVKKLEKLEAKEEDIVIPTTVIIWYLKKLKYDKKIYLLGSTAARAMYKEAGFEIADRGPDYLEESIDAFVKNVTDDLDIGAVIIDWDININHPRLMKAVRYLNRPDVLFLAGATDIASPFIDGMKIVGPGNFLLALEKTTDRVAIQFGKPSEILEAYIKENLAVDPDKALFTGDAIDLDIAFAKQCGFKKLLVFTGLNNLEDAKKSDLKPDYYINSVADFYPLLQKFGFI